MTDLTEQLKNGLYYIKDTNDNIYIDDYNKEIDEFTFAGTRLKEVLAPVPSYEEWQASEKYNKHLEEKIKIYERKDKQATETSIAYNKLAEENDKLKELLKWVVNATDFYHEIKTASVIDYGAWYDIANETNQALGEDK